MRMSDVSWEPVDYVQHHFAQTSLSVLVYKKVRIKIHLYTLPVKITK